MRTKREYLTFREDWKRNKKSTIITFSGITLLFVLMFWVGSNMDKKRHANGACARGVITGKTRYTSSVNYTYEFSVDGETRESVDFAKDYYIGDEPFMFGCDVWVLYEKDNIKNSEVIWDFCNCRTGWILSAEEVRDRTGRDVND